LGFADLSLIARAGLGWAGDGEGGQGLAADARFGGGAAGLVIRINALAWCVRDHQAMWDNISNAPFDRDVELAVIDYDGPHALVFPCRRVLGGWTNAETSRRIDVHPTHWRPWDQASSDRFFLQIVC
jgi:hypothetical protein